MMLNRLDDRRTPRLFEFTQGSLCQFSPALYSAHRPYASVLGSMQSAVHRPSVRGTIDRDPQLTPIVVAAAGS